MPAAASDVASHGIRPNIQHRSAPIELVARPLYYTFLIDPGIPQYLPAQRLERFLIRSARAAGSGLAAQRLANDPQTDPLSHGVQGAGGGGAAIPRGSEGRQRRRTAGHEGNRR